jgi:Chitobiase/beta-hexosaminidase C-terminal domain
VKGISAIVFLLGAMALASSGARATTWTAASCNSSDVQSAINSASNGDTVQVPACPSGVSWTSGVAISGKYITFTGAGGGGAALYSSSTLTIGTGSKTLSVYSAAASSSPTISNGETLQISETGNRQNYMEGTVTSYTAGNPGSLTMNVTSTGGSCGNSAYQSHSDCRRWIVFVPASTVIVNNLASGAAISVTESTAGESNLSGFKIAEGAGTADDIDVNYASGGQAVLIHDIWTEDPTNPNSSSGGAIYSNTNRGVVWNWTCDNTPFSQNFLCFHHKDAPASSWTTPSNWGMADSTGQANFYVEDSFFAAGFHASDNDDNGRLVWRYNVLDNIGFGTHGADTSNYGQRYFDFDHNVGVFNDESSDHTTFNMQWWIFVRGGTFVAFDNTLPALVSQDYGTKPDIDIIIENLQRDAGPNPCWGAGTTGGADYHAPRQPGFGYVTGTGTDGLGRTNDSITYVGDSEPAYEWGNSREPLNVNLSDYGGTACSSPDHTSDYVHSGRDYFANATKPGFTAYTYPHPLRGNVVAVPSISPSPGTYTSPTTITIIDSTAGATICYTTSGAMPSAGTSGTCDPGSTTYSGSFSQSIPATVQAIGTLSGATNSGVATNTYALGGGTAATP